jgi:hypothetical protein
MNEYAFRVTEKPHSGIIGMKITVTKNITVETDSLEDAFNKVAKYAVSANPDKVDVQLLSITTR